MKKLIFAATCTAFLLTLFACSAEQTSEHLPSWNDGQSKQSIIEFVNTVTDKTSKQYIAPAERIAVFDNDGTLWSEQPMYFQLAGIR